MKIGFIGLGIMGSGMAANLQKNNVALIVHNRTKEKAAALLAGDAEWADSPRGTAAADMVFTMLAHPEAVAEVALGENGFLDGMRPGTLWVDFSTVNPDFSRQMAMAAAERGARFLEAPVLGTKPTAAAGELVIFAGGKAADLAEAELYLKMMGRKLAHIGPVGMAASMKVVINTMLAANMAVFAEALVLGQALGLSQELLLETILGGPAAAPFLTPKSRKIASGDYDTQFPLRWMQKDLQLAAVSAYEVGAAMPMANTAKELYRLAIRAGLGDQDFSAIYEFLNRAD